MVSVGHKTFLVPIGDLPPCREVEVTKSPIRPEDVQLLGISVRFTDAAGQDWIRSKGGGPPEADDRRSYPENAQWGGCTRSEIRSIENCAPL
jgi:hypothetical protein